MTLAASPAVVSRPPGRPADPDQYLRFNPGGAVDWTSHPEEAATFASMREAARAALHLPAAVRAFALPLHTELALH